MTFARFRRRARVQASLLRDHAVIVGDRVVLVMPQGIPAMTTFVGAMMLGAVPAILAYPNFKVEPAKYRFGLAGVTAKLAAKVVMIASYAVLYPDFTYYIWMPLKTEKAAAHEPSAPPTTQARMSFQSRLDGRVNNLLKYTLPSAVQNELRQFVIRREIATRHYVVMERLPEERVEPFRQDLQKLVATLRSYGVEPILVTHATFFQSRSRKATA